MAQFFVDHKGQSGNNQPFDQVKRHCTEQDIPVNAVNHGVHRMIDSIDGYILFGAMLSIMGFTALQAETIASMGMSLE